VIASVPALEDPNEERNPLDLMLGALATCGSFVYERVAQEQVRSSLVQPESSPVCVPVTFLYAVQQLKTS
jgi:hypothetical protein